MYPGLPKLSDWTGGQTTFDTLGVGYGPNSGDTCQMEWDGNIYSI